MSRRHVLVETLILAVAVAGSGTLGATAAHAATAQARSTADACRPTIAPRGYFFDVGLDGAHAGDVDCLWWWGIAAGDMDGNFLPAQPIRRDEAATFLARLVVDTGGTLPATAPDAFSDDQGDVHESNIDALAAAGIVSGDPAGIFRPSGSVSRGQMASWVVKTYGYRSGRSLPVAGGYFPDISTSAFAQDIDAAAAAGLVVGYPDGAFRPDAAMTRAQVASVLARVLGLLVDVDGAHAPGTGATITSVTPVATGRMLPSPAENTTFCIYDAAVAISWKGATRLDAFPVIGGTRMAPGDTVNLVGDGSTTVTVADILVPVGQSAQLEAVAGQLTNGPYLVLADVTDSRVITCS